LRLTLRDFLRVVAQLIQLGADGFSGRECRIQVAFVGDQLAPHLGCCQAGREAMGAELRVGLALVVDKSADISQEIGEMRFRTLPPTQAKGLDTAHARREFARGALLPTRPQCFDGPCHKQATGTALE
jgi:hypothetical protein